MRAHTIIVGNCGSLPANILLLPDAAIDDGVLDVVILKPQSAAGWVRSPPTRDTRGLPHRRRRPHPYW